MLIYYPTLCTRSRRALCRKYRKGFGREYIYEPRQILIDKLSKKFGHTPAFVKQQLLDERRTLMTLKGINSNG